MTVIQLVISEFSVKSENLCNITDHYKMSEAITVPTWRF